MGRNWATPSAFDRDTWRTACELVRKHGRNATTQACRHTDERIAERDLSGVLTCILVAEAVKLLLTDHPQTGERIH
jgi:hypothetical protein